MAHATLVKVLDAGNELAVKLSRLLFGQARVTHDIIEELATICIFHDHEKLFLCFDDLYNRQLKGLTVGGTYLVELDDVGVAHLLQNFDLAGDALNVFLVVDLLFLQDFDGNLRDKNAS